MTVHSARRAVTTSVSAGPTYRGSGAHPSASAQGVLPWPTGECSRDTYIALPMLMSHLVVRLERTRIAPSG